MASNIQQFLMMLGIEAFWGGFQLLLPGGERLQGAQQGLSDPAQYMDKTSHISLWIAVKSGTFPFNDSADSCMNHPSSDWYTKTAVRKYICSTENLRM